MTTPWQNIVAVEQLGHIAPDIPVYELDMAVINIVPHVRIVMKICGASSINVQPKS